MQNPDKYLPYVAGTLSSLGSLDRNLKRIEAARAHYAEALSIYKKLAKDDPAKYAADIARLEASLNERDKEANSP
jgi:hypothetical protein